MTETRCKGLHRLEVRDRHGEVLLATLELKFRRIKVLPAIGKQNRYPSLDLTVLHATERGKPRGRDRIEVISVKKNMEPGMSSNHGSIQFQGPAAWPDQYCSSC